VGLARVRAVLLAEDLLLLLTDDTKGRLSAPGKEVEVLLAGANLAELALMGRVDISPEPVRLIVRDRSPTGDAVLDETLETVIGWQGPPIHVIQAVIGQSGKNMRKTLYERWSARARFATSDAESCVTGGRLKIPATRWRCADG
jgi:Golgi phosphoprotein 3 (GPP34)